MKTLIMAIMAFSLMYSMSALSGNISTKPVTIDFDTRKASGDMYTARTTENNNLLIGCGVTAIEDPAFSWVYCQAGDPTAEIPNDPEIPFVGCWTDNPEMMKAVGLISAYSYIGFEWNDDAPENDPFWNTCSRIQISSQSQYLPFTPEVKEKSKN